MKKILFAALLVLLASTSLRAQVSTTNIAPTADLLASQTSGGAQYLVDVNRNPGQGQSCQLAIENLKRCCGPEFEPSRSGGDEPACVRRSTDSYIQRPNCRPF